MQKKVKNHNHASDRCYGIISNSQYMHDSTSMIHPRHLMNSAPSKIVFSKKFWSIKCDFDH
jgi:hypothetical protein